MKLILLTKSPDLSSHLDQPIKQYVNVDVVKLGESSLIPNACKQMIKMNIDEIVVIDKNETPVGLVTDEDILKKNIRSLCESCKNYAWRHYDISSYFHISKQDPF